MTAAARTASARRAFDVSLGPDSSGRVVALYTRCRTRDARLRRLPLRPARPPREPARVGLLAGVRRGLAGAVARARRVRRAAPARTSIDGYDHRPDPRGRGPLMDCDIPYVKTLSSRAPSRRLDRSQCGATTGIAIRGATIVHVTDIDQGGAGSESQVRLLRAGGGAARILARTGGGEGGYSPFVLPEPVVVGCLADPHRPPPGGPAGLPAHRAAVAAADDGAGEPQPRRARRARRARSLLVRPRTRAADLRQRAAMRRSSLEPCRLVRASASPFSTTARTLLPRLGVDGAQSQSSRVRRRSAAAVGRAGADDRAPGAVAATAPCPACAGRCCRTSTSRRRARPSRPAVDDDRRDRTLVVSRSIGRHRSSRSPSFAPALKLASLVVEVVAVARITLTASGRSLSGTVAPAQPGRTVQIQRLSVDAHGRLPGRPAGVRASGDARRLRRRCLDDRRAGAARRRRHGFSATVARPASIARACPSISTRGGRRPTAASARPSTCLRRRGQEGGQARASTP